MFETGSGCVLEGVRFFVATEFQMFLSFFAAPLQGVGRAGPYTQGCATLRPGLFSYSPLREN